MDYIEVFIHEEFTIQTTCKKSNKQINQHTHINFLHPFWSFWQRSFNSSAVCSNVYIFTKKKNRRRLISSLHTRTEDKRDKIETSIFPFFFFLYLTRSYNLWLGLQPISWTEHKINMQGLSESHRLNYNNVTRTYNE